MPRAPREQPAQPAVEAAPKAEPASLEEKTGKPASEPTEAKRPRQTQQTSAEGRVVEGTVPQIELFVPESITDEDLAKLNVYQRWNRCIGEIGLVPKRGWNNHHSYWFTTDADLNAFIGPLFRKYHLVVLPTILLDQVLRIEPSPGGKQWLTRVPMHVRVINADKPEDLFEVDWIGEGADTVDKGVYKAFTGGLKYFYMKLLQVATGDDPETFTQTDRLGQMAAENAVSGQPRPEQRQVNIQPSSRPQPAKGGRQAGATEVQLRQINAMRRALHLNVEGTAAFFDNVLGTSIHDTIEGIENDDEKATTLGEWIKRQAGPDVGRIIYEMGEEAKRRKEVSDAEAREAPVAEASGAPENEEVPLDSEDDLLEQAANSVQ